MSQAVKKPASNAPVIDDKIIEKLHDLARFQYNPQATGVLKEKLNGIMSFVGQLDEVNTDHVTPMASNIDLQATLRPDVVNDGHYRDQILENAPDAAHGFFTVPKVVE